MWNKEKRRMECRSYIKKLKRTACLFLSVACMMQGSAKVLASEYWPEGPDTGSPSVMLMELSTGTVLYEKNSTEEHYPASITKILTTLVALENASLDEVVTFSDRAINETMGSGIARDYGEQMTVEQCLYAVMLESANECAFAVAEHVGGTMEKFVDMMNEKAKELGCKNTHFSNPHGLQDENHYTSAHDMALIAQAAYENETFRIITGTKIYTIPPTNKHPNEDTVLRNHHDMLVPYHHTQYVYENCVGGKTGYTDAANTTLVTYGEKDGMTLVCVVMNTQSPNQYLDTRSLLDYGFDNFQLVNIGDNETKYQDAETVETGALSNSKAFVDIDEKASILLPKTAEFADASSEIIQNEETNDVVGTISYTYAGHEVGSADIVKTGVTIEEFAFDNRQQDEEEMETEAETEAVSTVNIKPQSIVWTVVILILAAVLLYVAKRFYDNYYIIRHNMQIRRNEKTQFRSARKNVRRNARRHKRRRK